MALPKFSAAFTEAGGINPLSYSGLIRVSAFICLIIAVVWTVNGFFSAEQKESEGFMDRLVSRILRIVIAVTCFTAFITIKG